MTENVHRDYTGAKIGMWLFLFTELLLFGGMFLLYSVYRARYSGEFHEAAKELNVSIGALNTLILLTSSLTMAMAISATQTGRKAQSLALQYFTILCGMGFMVNKYIEWSAKFHHGIYPNSPELLAMPHGEIIFFGLYFVMTGLHGAHVLIGMSVIGYMTYFTHKDMINAGDYVKLENAGLYWHLVDLIWIYLFPLFYLIT